MLVSTTVLKFTTGSTSPGVTTIGGLSSIPSSTTPTSMTNLTNLSGATLNGNVLTINPLPWESDKFSPVKLESPDTNLDDIVLDHSASSDFAELKPLAPFDDYGNTALTGLDPVLSAQANNNNSSNNKDMNSNSPTSTMQYSSGSNCSHSDVTSSGSTSPPGLVAKIDTLDFNKNDLDDLASIVGISIDADSTVPNGDSDIADLDWIDSIKPLNCEFGLDSIGLSSVMNNNVVLGNSTLHRNIMNNPVISASQPYLQMNATTLQTLLQGNVQSHGQLLPKVTQLQQRSGGASAVSAMVASAAPPPPYSILQSRLQHGPLGGPPSVAASHVIKVDSTYDLMKSEVAQNPAYLAASNASSSYSDSLPHSTQQAPDQGLQRRLNELGGLHKIKKKQTNTSGGHATGLRPKLTGLSAAGGTPNTNGDQKKMTHHCQICNRGFLNKSNIKVHMRTHTGEKPFKCEHCSKAFRQKAHLLKHMSIHKRISRD